MYRRAFPKLHHRQAAESTFCLTCPILCLDTPVRKRATRCFNSVNGIHHRAIASNSSEKDTAARAQVGDLQHTISAEARQLATKDIIIDDLRATLEAHRATNRAAVLRKVTTTAPSDDSIYRPPLGQALAHNVEPEHELADSGPAEGKRQIERDGARRRPAHSVKRQRVRQGRHGSGDKTPAEDVGEYVGKSLRPKGYWRIRGGRDMQRPWLAHLDSHDGDGLARLEAEIRAYESYMRPTAAEERACQLLVEEITSTIGKALPDNPLEVIGSRRTGLATPTSDIDFSLSIPEYEKKDPTVRGPSPLRPEARKVRKRKLFKVKDALHQSHQFVDLELVYARVPVVTGLHRHTGLPVHFQSLHPTLAARSCIAGYLSEYPTLRSLYILLRSALDMRSLTTVFEGGFGSYTIFMMIVNALKHASIPSSTGYDITRHDLAAQLFWVLNFYATADLRQHGYSPDPPRVFPKVEERLVRSNGNANAMVPTLHEVDTIFKYKPKQPYLLCLQDPADPTNDLGSKSHSIMHVQETFRVASEALERALQHWDNMSSEDRKGWPKSLLDALVGAHYGRFTDSRKILAGAAAQAGKGRWRAGGPSRVPIPLRNQKGLVQHILTTSVDK